jgi:hypothetical protein
MSLYSISLFLHIVGALGLFGVLVLELVALLQLRRATGAGPAREWARLLAAGRVGGPAALLTLVTGIHLTATTWGPRGWIVVGLAGMVAIAVLGGAVSGRRTGAIVRAFPAGDGPIPATLGRRLHDPVLALSMGVRVALFLGVVFLMSTKPGTAGALATTGVAVVAGLAAGLPARRGRGEARMAGSER